MPSSGPTAPSPPSTLEPSNCSLALFNIASYAHVHLETAEGAAAAVTGLNGKKFGENEVKVEAARPRRPRRPARCVSGVATCCISFFSS